MIAIDLDRAAKSREAAFYRSEKLPDLEADGGMRRIEFVDFVSVRRQRSGSKAERNGEEKIPVFHTANCRDQPQAGKRPLVTHSLLTRVRFCERLQQTRDYGNGEHAGKGVVGR